MNKLLNKILIFSVGVFVFSLLGFLIFNFFKPKGITGLNVKLIGPNEVNSLEKYRYQISVENGSNINLKDVNLKIDLSQGVFFPSSEKELSLSLGYLKAKDSFNQNVDLFFINEGGIKENIKIALNYKIENKEAIFEKEENFSVLVKNPPIKVQIYLPEKIYVNQEFQANFRIINLTKERLNNLKVNIEVPSYFLLISSFPKTENFYFEFSSIKPLETKNISLVGQIQNIKSSGIFALQTSFNFQNNSYSLLKEIAKLNILENPVSFEIKSIPSDDSVPIGSNLYYEINLENKSQILLEDNEIRVSFDGPFDLSSLNSDGYFSQIDQVLYWNSRNKPELLNLKPKDRIKFNFNINLYQSYPVLGGKNKDFSAKIRVEFRSKTIPVEVEVPTKEYIVYQEDEKKIIGQIQVSQELVYNDEYFKGEGPLPLEINKPTNLAWHIKIKTIGEDFENFSLNTKLPIGVNLTNKVAGDALLDNLKFDSRTGSFIYSLSNLKANLGYLDKEMDLVFQIVVIPPANVDLNNFIIIPQLQYNVLGSFSKVKSSNFVREIYSSQINR